MCDGFGFIDLWVIDGTIVIDSTHFQMDMKMAQVQQFLHSLAFAIGNLQQQEQLLQRVPPQKRAQVLLRAQQIRQQMQQQQQQQQQQNVGEMGIGQSQDGMGMGHQPGLNVLPSQQQQQNIYRRRRHVK